MIFVVPRELSFHEHICFVLNFVHEFFEGTLEYLVGISGNKFLEISVSGVVGRFETPIGLLREQADNRQTVGNTLQNSIHNCHFERREHLQSFKITLDYVAYNR